MKFEEETATKFAIQQAKIEKRRADMAIRENQRLASMEEKRREVAARNEAKRMEKEKRILEARDRE